MKTSEAKSWYVKKRSDYDALSLRINNDLKNILDSLDIDYHQVEHRCKTIESFEKKIQGGISYDHKEMQDLAGIRVIGYILSDIEKISNAINENFNVDETLSKNKSTILGQDKVGYQSVHFVCSISEDRTQLPEYSKFKNMKFEIQVRTLLQHAWAEIEHDRKYKFSGRLPKGIPRRFNLISGMLEMADSEFERITKLVDEYSEDVKNKTEKGDLDVDINPNSLKEFLKIKFKDSKNLYHEFGPNDSVIMDCISELELMGITTLKDLNEIISSEYVDALKDASFGTHTFAGIIRDILIIKDTDYYFKNAWQDNWHNIPSAFKDLERFGITQKTLSKYLKEKKD